MALESHLAELSEKHRRLDHMLHEEMKHPASDSFRIKELKKQKLQIKQEIERLRRS